ncbi:MAG: inositol monophosphatase family protein [Phycisphaerales bacterium]
METDLEVMARLTFAREAARAAEGVILKHFGSSGSARFEVKSDGSPVTVADRGAEELIRGLIARDWGSDGVVGEEFGASEGRSGYRWVIDPIDGTKSFVHGVPLFGTLIGVQCRDEGGGPAGDGWRSVAGVVNFPALGERAWGSLGEGAWHQRGEGEPRAARVSAVARLAEAAVSTSCPKMMDEHGGGEVYRRLNRRCGLSRGWSDCYGTLLVATGRIEVMIDPPMKLWDVAALEPIVMEAGGRLTGWDGRPTDGSTGAVASNGLVHEEVIEVVRLG